MSKHLKHAFALPLCSFGIWVGSFDFVYNFRGFFLFFFFPILVDFSF